MQLRTVTLADSTPSDPEIVHEQEIGIKTTFLGGRGRFNVAGYHNKVSDAQRSPVLAPNGVSQTVIENADTETWGVEADASIEVVDGFTRSEEHTSELPSLMRTSYAVFCLKKKKIQ